VNGVLPVSVGYAAIGGSSVLAGAVLSVRTRLSDRTRSLVQHAAAGTVLAGLVIDVLAKLIHRPGQLTWTAIGMVGGLAGMLAIRRFAGDEGSDGMGSLVVTVVTDILGDGVLIGLSAALGAGTGLLFAIALAPEMGLLGVTAAEALVKRWPAARIIAAAAVTGAAITGAGGLGWLAAQGPQALIAAVLGLGASVIIYLILEELLREAHETDEGPVEVAILFACFLPFFLAGIAAG
jgi:ZIP family zinc transporter